MIGLKTTKKYTLTVVLEQDEDGRFIAICPTLPGCYTEGETEAEAIEMIRDAIRLHLEDYLERNEPIMREIGTYQVDVAV
jgi:antitoxin HicB